MHALPPTIRSILTRIARALTQNESTANCKSKLPAWIKALARWLLT